MTKDKTLVLKRVLPASRKQVFAAWTQADLVKQWFSPGDLTVPTAELDVRKGGSYRIVMQGSDGETHSPAGTYEEVVPNEKLVFTWKWAGAETVTRVTVEFKSLGPQETELTLVHEGFLNADERNQHSEGWSGCLRKLPMALA